MPTSLRNGLGGASGFGENFLGHGDDNSTASIDLTPVFGASGLNFYGMTFTSLFINNNGSISFGGAVGSYNDTLLTGATGTPAISVFHADIDTRPLTTPISSGGNSTGSNLVWYDFEATARRFTATWDDVGYFNNKTDKTNAFQIELAQLPGAAAGDFNITFRYENVSWTTGDLQTLTDDGLGGTIARAGFSAGDGVRFYELPQSGNQTAMLELENARNTGLSSIADGTFVFTVRGGQPKTDITIGDASVTEGNTATSTVQVPVYLTMASATTVTVNFATSNNTALAGQDYFTTSGTLSFAPGETLKYISIAIIGDTTFETDETFTVNLSNASSGAILNLPTSTITIRNDDTSYRIFNAQALLEGNSGSRSFSFDITRQGNLNAATVNWAVDTALSQTTGADFSGGTSPSGTISFAAGENNRTVTVNVAGDTAVEPDETFVVRITSPAGATIETATASGVIRNDDAVLSIAATSASKAEGSSGTTPFTFTVTRTGEASAKHVVDWAVSNTTTDAADFSGFRAGFLAFDPGETSKTITLNVAGDRRAEADETFQVVLSNPIGSATLGTATATGTIRNDDVNVAPVLTPVTFVTNLARNNAEPLLSSLVSLTDANGDSMTRWQLWDNTPGSGVIVTPGGLPPAQTLIDLTGDDFNVSRYGSEGGYDNLYARAFDGTAWSEWTNFWVVAPPNKVPVVNAPFAFLTRANANPTLASLFSITDADGDTAQGWQFWDATPGNGSFRITGIDQPAQRLMDFDPGTFANGSFRSTTGFDEIYVRAFDGFEWSAWKQTYIVAPVNVAPEVTASSARMPNGVIGLSLSGLVSATDAEGDAIQKWQIWDVTPDGGSLFANGTFQPAMTQIELTANGFSTARVSGGATGDSYWIRGFDGFDWSEWENFTVTAPANNTVPVLTGGVVAVNGANVTRSLASLFTYADAQTARLYQLWDNTPGNGAFRISSIAQAAQTVIEVFPEDFSATSFTSGAGDDNVYIRAWDGYDWSAWTLVKIDNLVA